MIFRFVLALVAVLGYQVHRTFPQSLWYCFGMKIIFPSKKGHLLRNRGGSMCTMPYVVDWMSWTPCPQFGRDDPVIRALLSYEINVVV